MFDTRIEATVVVTAVILWFAQGWYLNTRLEGVHRKLDRILETFDGLRRYLYEIGPQFDDERRCDDEFFENHEGTRNPIGAGFAAMESIEIEKRKKQEGKRTLHTGFVD